MKRVRLLLAAIAIIAFSLAAILSIYSPTPEKEPIKIKVTPYQPSDSLSLESESQPTQQAEPADLSDVARVHYLVKIGDTLSTIFSSWGLSYPTLQSLLEADLESLKLDTIKPGDSLELVIDRDKQKLLQLTYHQSIVERAVFTQRDDGSFAYKFHEEQGKWQQKLYSGKVAGSFSVSAYKQGLNPTQIANITRVLRDKVDFKRDFRLGDGFNVLVSEQYLGDHLTGNNEIKAISLQLGRKEVAAFLAKDGRFYDREGNSLEQAFDRYPIAPKYRRITSSFNPKRKHPVTGRISPHNGTDFATPVGAPVYSTGDGKVIAVRNHPYAGKYLVIEHNSVYKTRYLHLHRFLVKKGQQVKRGQKIALAGATGRLTGPHLHYEVLVRNKAVNAMKADLPLATSISKKDKAQFLAEVKAFDQWVEKQQSQQVDSAENHDVS
ncbi:peptidoglycan DD-metalloendopeptidase family protein [Vibrio intestinalis]|uniref:peptidoglycan DD-metalloendopeptidase family protein n=1 Tax=Vibrio intestinalis TaxID=2933291 RepID=UPI0021A5E09A|nr:peptidoglycan DD-metalloendopeptidase family protein [Vibrio intestinalis]